MKRVFALATVLVFALAILVTATGCRIENDSNEAAKAALIATLEFASEFVDEFPEEARQATAEEKEGLEKEAQDTLDSIQELEDEVNQNPDEFTDEEKQQIQTVADNVRAKVQEGLDILATK